MLTGFYNYLCFTYYLYGLIRTEIFFIHLDFYLIFFRGGVLEPEGTVEIKFREKDLLTTMKRIDPQVKQIVEQMNSPELSEEQTKKLEDELKKRKDLLLPMYHQVAVQFADLHDTPGRMEEKSVISVSEK